MTLLAIIIGLIPGFVWLLFYLQEDRHPEPKKLIAKTLLFGAISAFVALITQYILNYWVEFFDLQKLLFVSLLLFALVEETAKFFAAYLSINKNKAFNEPIDAMIYMVAAAMGFATVENLFAISSSEASQASLLTNFFSTASLRFIGATLLHTLSSGLLGYWWAMGIRRFNDRRFIVWGLFIATALHAIFNFLIIHLGNIIHPVIFLIVVGFFVLGDFEKLKNKGI